MLYGDLTYLEIRQRAEDDWLAVVPTGCTEQQGPHLPVDLDTWLAEQVVHAAAEKASQDYGIYALVLPAMPFGPTPEHRNFGSGYIDIPRDLHETLVYHVLLSLSEQGFRRLVVWRGCGGHDLSGAVGRFNEEHGGQARAFLPALPYHEVWCQVGDRAVPGGHADSFATSINLYLRPEAVHVDRIPKSGSEPPDWDDPNLDFTRYSSTGVIGDPPHYSAELGKRLWEACVEAVALILKDIAEQE